MNGKIARGGLQGLRERSSCFPRERGAEHAVRQTSAARSDDPYLSIYCAPIFLIE